MNYINALLSLIFDSIVGVSFLGAAFVTLVFGSVTTLGFFLMWVSFALVLYIFLALSYNS
jgi:hypothetical protein